MEMDEFKSNTPQMRKESIYIYRWHFNQFYMKHFIRDGKNYHAIGI